MAFVWQDSEIPQIFHVHRLESSMVGMWMRSKLKERNYSPMSGVSQGVFLAYLTPDMLTSATWAWKAFFFLFNMCAFDLLLLLLSPCSCLVHGKDGACCCVGSPQVLLWRKEKRGKVDMWISSPEHWFSVNHLSFVFIAILTKQIWSCLVNNLLTLFRAAKLCAFFIWTFKL